MRFRVSSVCLFALLALPATANVLYTNGAVNGYLDAFFLSGGSTAYVVSDSFTLASDSTLTGVSNIGIWADNGGTPDSFDWTISTATYGGGTVEASGSGFTSSTELITDNGTGGNRDDNTVWSVGFTLSNLDLSAGTYYLTLSNGGVDRWDATLGPSSAYDEILVSGVPFSSSPISSESFEIDGPDSGVPEPGAFLLLATGLVALAVRYRAGISHTL